MNDQKIKIAATNDTDRAFNAINNNVNRVSNNLLSAKNAFSGFIGVAGVTQLTRFAKDSIEFADAIAKTSSKLGLSTDALQEYRFAAERGNIEQTALDTGLQRFTRRLGEAAEGTGVLYKVLKDNNIQIRDTEGNLRNTEDVLRDYANTIQGAETDQEKLLLAFKAFDTEGAAMVNILRNGSTGLDDLRQSARDAGVVMDAELIRKAEIINDRWETLTDTIGTKFKSALIGLSGAFVDTRTSAEVLGDINENIRIQEDLLTKLKAKSEGFEGWFFGGSDRIGAIEASLVKLREEAGRVTQAIETDSKKGGDSPLVVAMGLTDQQIQDTIALDGYVWQLLQIERQAQIDKAALLETKALENNLGPKLEKLNQSFLSEKELLQLQFEEKQALVDEAFMAGVLMDIERDAMLENIAIQHEDKLTEIKNKGLTDRQKFERLSTMQQTQFVLGNLTSLLAISAQHNKTFFKLNKVAGIANAIVNTSEGVTKSLSAYPYPINIGMAAATLAAGMAQVNNIRQQQFGGGGGVPTVNSVSVPSTTSTISNGGAESVPGASSLLGSSTQATVAVSMPDDDGFYSGIAMRKFIEEMLKTAEDMGPNTKIVIA